MDVMGGVTPAGAQDVGAADGVTARKRLPWQSLVGMGPQLEQWRSSGLWRHVTMDRLLEGTDAAYAQLPEMHGAVAQALSKRGVSKLYSHQAQAFGSVMAGQHTCVATPTASGKSFCYNLPVLQSLAEDPSTRALYLFPTKALARDQEANLRTLLSDAGLDIGAITYDGDTPGDARRAAKERAGVMLTNPDMLHAGILPHHTQWARLFAGLKYVVIDEVHTYRGVFGSHFANVMRRLKRVAAFHGAHPTFVLASATIGNPQEHGSRLIGEPVTLVDQSGAPTGPRRVAFYNPPVVNAELGVRQSYLKASVRITADLVQAEVPTLLFGQSRNSVEIMLKYLRDRLSRKGVDPRVVHAYRGGYLPADRRKIEQQLRDGELRAVVATQALELGIDIGSLDAVVCAGYPGNVASLWQRFGRGGRRQGESLAMLVASSAPLDQFVAQQPEYVLGAPVEQARIDPDHAEILVQHMKCAAFELPVGEDEPFGEVPAESTGEVMGFLQNHGLVHRVPNEKDGTARYHWADEAYPANHVSLRSAGWDNVVIIEEGTDRVLGELDWHASHTMLHEQAIYQHDGSQYQVERFDYDNFKAFVKPVKPDYYTTAKTYTQVSVLDPTEQVPFSRTNSLVSDELERSEAGVRVGLGELSVVEKVVGYKKVRFHTHENVGYGEVRLPAIDKQTTGIWYTFSESLVASMEMDRPEVVDALRGMSQAMHTVASSMLMVDPRDLGRAMGDCQEPGGLPGKTQAGGGHGFDPTIFLYDQISGGVGLSDRLFEVREDIAVRARRIIERCDCDAGCPACIGPSIGAEPLPGVEHTQDMPVAVSSPQARKDRVLEIFSAMGVVAEH